MTADRPLLGITFMLVFCALAPLGDALAKLLGEVMPIVILVLVRFSIQAVILSPLVVLSGRSLIMRERVLRLTILRTLLHISGVGTMFAALTYLPLADAVAIAFVMPFLMLLLGSFVLGEEVGARRMAACAVGFIGTLLVVKPSFAEVGWPALLPLGVAVFFALFMLVTRQVAKQVDAITLQAVSGIIAVPILMAAVAISGATWPQNLSTETTLLLGLVGVVGTVGHLFMTWSLRFAPSATLAPMQYLEIPFATLLGWLIFRDLPDGLAALGIAITVAAGLYVIYRERVTAAA